MNYRHAPAMLVLCGILISPTLASAGEDSHDGGQASADAYGSGGYSPSNYRLRGSTVEFTIPDVSLAPVSAWTHKHDLQTSAWAAGSFAQSVPNGSDLVALPFHQDLGTMQLDQVWLSISRSSSASQPLGGQLNLAYGKNSSTLRAQAMQMGSGATGSSDGSATDDQALTASLNQALVGDTPITIVDVFASYRIPVSDNAVTVTMGKLPDPTGAEAVNTITNYNISRGITWGLHPGEVQAMTLSSNFGAFTVSSGISSNVTGAIRGQIESDSHLLARVDWGGESQSAFLSTMVGTQWQSGAEAGLKRGIINGVYNKQAGPNTSLWVNGDWAYTGEAESRLDTFALSSAARTSLSETLGVAVRGEAMVAEYPTQWVPQVSGTATIDKRLDNNIILRGEGRWDRVFADDAQAKATDGASVPGGQQMTLVGELVYRF